MAELDQMKAERPKRFRLDWLLSVFLRPREAFTAIAAESGAVWLAPLVILVTTGSIQAIISGVMKMRSGAGGVSLGPTATVIFPLLAGIIGVVVSWLLVSSAVHLALMVQGGRSTQGTMSNIVAWAALPLALRDLVRIVAMLIAGRPIMAAGVSGFISAGAVGGALFFRQLLAMVDLYMIWHVVLIITGVNQSGAGLPKKRVALSMVLVILLLALIRAAAGFAIASLGNLSPTQSFFYF